MKRILITIAALSMTACNMHYSDGSRMGVVRKFSQKGFFCKTWEGKAVLPVEGTLQAEEFEFAVTKQEVIPKVIAAMKAGSKVELVYEQLAFTTPCSPLSDYRIIDVK